VEFKSGTRENKQNSPKAKIWSNARFFIAPIFFTSAASGAFRDSANNDGIYKGSPEDSALGTTRKEKRHTKRLKKRAGGVQRKRYPGGTSLFGEHATSVLAAELRRSRKNQPSPSYQSKEEIFVKKNPGE